MQRTIEVNDVLQERSEMALEEVQDRITEYLDENRADYIDEDTIDSHDIISDVDYDGSLHEIIDGCVPVYHSEIETAWYLHSNDLEEAYENAGIGENPRENHGMTAIYFYIEQYVYENLDVVELFESWLADAS